MLDEASTMRCSHDHHQRRQQRISILTHTDVVEVRGEDSRVEIAVLLAKRRQAELRSKQKPHLSS